MKGRIYEFLKEKLVEGVPITGFEGTVFGYPLHYAISGNRYPEAEAVEQALDRIRDQEGGYHLDALWLSELIESTYDDSGDHFIGDDRFRSICVGLNEGTNGWALIVGEGNDLAQLISELTERRFRIFTSGKASRKEASGEGIQSLSERDTGIVYFGQMMARYALIYGMAQAGEAHEVSHSIEEFAPGAVFVVGELSDVERTLLQGMLALGAPVVALDDDRGLVGHVHVASSVPEMVEKGWELPNIRSRLVEKPTPEMPVPIGQPFTREQLNPDDLALQIKGSPGSFMVVRPSPSTTRDSIEVRGSVDDASGFSVLVELGNEAADPPVTLWVEAILRRVINMAKGVKVRKKGGGVMVYELTEQASDAGFTLNHLGELVINGLRNEFGAIGPIEVTFILDGEEEGRLSPEISDYVEERTKIIRETSEDDLDVFYGCVRCRSFALAHACTVTPDRPAQCSKPWYQIKANAVLDPGDIYNGCELVEKGECLDPVKGEYEGVNASTEKRSEGRVGRVFLHSVFDHPHTSCSCFQNVVYHIPEVDGLAIVHRGYEGEAPGGMTWTKLANMVAGRQYREGAAAIATAYLLSRKFLQADGGYARVVWMTENLKRTALRAIPEELRDSIAIESDATTLNGLKAFLKEKERKIIGH